MTGFIVQPPLQTQLGAKAPEINSSVDDAVLDNGDLWDIIRPLNDAMNIAEGEAEYLASVAQFSWEQRAAHAIVWYVNDVQNGGHWQFFYNSTGILWEAAQKGLRNMGAGQAALLLSGAALRAGGSPPFELASRQSLMKRLSPRFADLDAKIGESEPLTQLSEFIGDNRSAFRFSDPKNA